MQPPVSRAQNTATRLWCGLAIVFDSLLFRRAAAGQVHPKTGVVMNRTSPRMCIEQLEIRGEDSDQQVGVPTVMRCAGIRVGGN